jgi:flavodoxin
MVISTLGWWTKNKNIYPGKVYMARKYSMTICCLLLCSNWLGAQTIIPEFKNLYWLDGGNETSRTLFGHDILIRGEAENIKDGTLVDLEIWEYNENENHDLIKRVKTRVSGGMIEYTWKAEFNEDDIKQCMYELENEGYTYPKCFFTIGYMNYKSNNSQILNVYDWVRRQFIENGKILRNTKYVLVWWDNTDRRGTTDENGWLYEEYVPFGDSYIVRGE